MTQDHEIHPNLRKETGCEKCQAKKRICCVNLLDDIDELRDVVRRCDYALQEIVTNIKMFALLCIVCAVVLGVVFARSVS